MKLFRLCGWALLAIIAVVAENNEFISPSKMDFDHTHIDGSYEIGSLMNLRWKTEWETVTVVLFQDGPQPFQYLQNSQLLRNTTSFAWTVDISGKEGNPSYDLRNGSLFFFGIFHSGTSNIFESQYFNITAKTVSSTPSSAMRTTTLFVLSQQASSTSSATTSTQPTSPPTSPSISPSAAAPLATASVVSASPQTELAKKTTSQSSGNNWKIGVGLGIAVLALLAIGITGWYLWRRRRIMTAHATYAPAAMETPRIPQEKQLPLPPIPYRELGYHGALAEMPVPDRHHHTRPIYEM